MRTNGFLKVDVPKPNNLYHVKWAYSKGVVGRCIEVDQLNRRVKMRSPKTKKDWNCWVSFDDLYHVRRMQKKLTSHKN